MSSLIGTAWAGSAMLQMPGSFGVSASGTAQYSIPIAVPPGTGGMAPSLALTYASSSGNGLLGMGWSLAGLPAITRCAPTIEQDGIATSAGVTFTAQDDFCYRGQKLIAINSGAYGAPATEYRTELESFTRIVSYGSISYPTGGGSGPAYFIAIDRAGNKTYFGRTTYSPNSQILPYNGTIGAYSTVPATWAVSRVYDEATNYMTVLYTTAYQQVAPNPLTSEVEPSEIDYTGNTASGQAPYAAVVFNYGLSQPTTIKTHQAGFASTTSVLLTDIDTYTGTADNLKATLVSDYRLLYATGTSGRALVQSVTHCDGGSGNNGCDQYGTGSSFNPVTCMNDGDCLPPTSFTYSSIYQIGTNYTNSTIAGWNGTFANQSFFTGDFGGTGSASLLWLQPAAQSGTLKPSQTATIWLNNGTEGFTQPGTNLTLPATVQGQTCGQYTAAVAGDFNGDGKQDMYFSCDIGGYAFLSQGAGKFSTSYAVNPPASCVGTPVVGDFDGDGRADLFFALNSTTYCIERSNGDGTFTALGPTTAPVAFTSVQVGDFNGDGRADLLVYSGGTSYSVLLSNGDGTFNRVTMTSPGAGWVPTVGNFGQDGNAGIFWVQMNQTTGLSTGSYQLWIGHGDGTFSSHALSGSAGFLPFFGDLQGTGRTDIFWDDEDSNGISTNSHAVWLNNGDATFRTVTLSGAPSTTGYHPFLYDFDGDGHADILWDTPHNNEIGTSNGTRMLWSSRVNATSGHPSDLIKTITTGLGAVNTVSYGFLTSDDIYTKYTTATFPIMDLQSALPVVTTVAADAGIGGSPLTTYNTNYTYQGAKLDLQGRGFLGFRARIATDQQGKSKTDDYYAQWPYTSLTSSSSTNYGNTTLSNTVNTYTTAPYTSIGTTAGGNPAPGYILVELEYVDQTQNDLDGTSMGGSKASYTYDNFANLTGSTVTTTDPTAAPYNTGVFTSTTKALYWAVINPTPTSISPGTWVPGRLACFQSVSTVPSGATATRTTDYLYASNWLVKEKIVEPTDDDSAAANPLGSQTAQCEGAGGVVRLETDYARDSYGNVKTETEVPSDGVTTASRVTSYLFSGDPENRYPTQVTDPLSHVSNFTYSAGLGTVLTATDPNTLQTTVTPDPFGRPLTVTHPDGSYDNYTYEYCSSIGGTICGTGQQAITIHTRYSSNQTTLAPRQQQTYDTLGRTIYAEQVEFDNTGHIRTNFSYDANLNMSQKSGPVIIPNSGSPAPAPVTSWSFDALNRPVLQDLPDNGGGQDSFDSYAYHGFETITTAYSGASGSPLTQTATVYKHRTGDPLESIDNVGNITAATPGPFGDTASIVDLYGTSSKQTTSYTYDPLGRVTAEQDPDTPSGNTWSATYNAWGQVWQRTNANGQITSSIYDLTGRPTERVENSGASTPDMTSYWHWDHGTGGPSGTCIGLLTNAQTVVASPVQPAGVPGGYLRTEAYDSLCRPLTTTTQMGGSGGTSYTTTTSYDSYGRYAGTSYPDGYAVEWLYNAVGYPSEVKGLTTIGGSTYTTLYTVTERDAFLNATTVKTGDGLTTTRSFDLASRPELEEAVNSAGTAMFEQQYTWNDIAVGTLAERQDLVNNTADQFLYNGLNQLGTVTTTTASGGTLTKNFGYVLNSAGKPDGTGRLLSKTGVGTGNFSYSTTKPHELSSVLGMTPTYDADGNTLTSPIASGVVRTANWFSFDMPETVSGAGVSERTYYDPERRRAERVFTPSTGNPTTKNYFWDPHAAFEIDTSGGNTVNHDYVYGPDGVIATATVGTGNPTLYWSHRDFQGSAYLQTNAAGGLTYGNSYDAWGKRRFTNGTDDTGNTIVNSGADDRDYIAQEQLDTVELVDLNARLYDPFLGRFMSADPIGRAGGAALYGYAGNNPTGNSDPSGMLTYHPSPGRVLRQEQEDNFETQNDIQSQPDYQGVASGAFASGGDPGDTSSPFYREFSAASYMQTVVTQLTYVIEQSFDFSVSGSLGLDNIGAADSQGFGSPSDAGGSSDPGVIPASSDPAGNGAAPVGEAVGDNVGAGAPDQSISGTSGLMMGGVLDTVA